MTKTTCVDTVDDYRCEHEETKERHTGHTEKGRSNVTNSVNHVTTYFHHSSV